MQRVTDRTLANTVSDDDAPAPTPGSGIEAESLGRGAALGRYIVLDRLGEGGMGVVYAAYDPELDRKLAVKLLRDAAGSGGASDRRARLLREAQALARLGHPNIVAVYDVGTIGDQVFVAMELVPGRTVTAWLADKPRPWQEIVDVYRQAGRGLAAAHELGIVHRDFKPDNVLIGADGRVRVVDFGLAAAAEDAPEAPSKSPVAPEWESGAQLAISLTRTGALVGTPGYIAPEGKTLPAFDQFSFCVALWRALHGELPFAGTSATELTAAAARGEIREAKARVPAWLQRVLRRGLSADPAQRFPTMEQVVEELGKTPGRGYAIAAGIALPVIAIGALVLVPRHEASQVCRGADAELAGAWDPAAITAAFAATKVPYAESAASGVATVLDRYATNWAAMRTDACEATRVRGEQSEELFDLRMECLDVRARDLRALGDVFAHADAKTVEKSMAAAQTLLPIADCADATALRAPVRLPDSPIARAKIESLQGEIAEARALDSAGKYDDAIARAKPIVAQAQALQYRPLEASALAVLGGSLAHADKAAEAQTALEAAVNAAIAARDNGAATAAATTLIQIIGYDRAKFDEAEHWIARTKAFLEARPDDRLRGNLDNSIGNIRMDTGHYDEAVALHTEALALREKAYGKDSALVGGIYDNLGNDYMMKGDPAKASEYHKRALELEIAALGPTHPTIALTLTNLGGSLYDEGKIDESLAAELKAVAIKEAVYGKDSTMVAVSLHEIGNVYIYQKRYADAEAMYRRVVEIYKPALGPDHPRLGNAIDSLANAVRHQHRLDEAQALYEEALRIRLKAFGPDHHDVATTHIGLSQVAQERKQWDVALAHAQQAVDIYTKAVDADSPAIAEALTHVGNSQLGAGRHAKAIEAYTKALKLRERKDGDATDRADTQFGLAKALWESGDHDKARALAEDCDTVATAGGPHGKELHADIAEWQSAHSR